MLVIEQVSEWDALVLAWSGRALPLVYLSADGFVMEQPAPACGHSILCRPIFVPYRQGRAERTG